MNYLFSGFRQKGNFILILFPSPLQHNYDSVQNNPQVEGEGHIFEVKNIKLKAGAPSDQHFRHSRILPAPRR